MVRVETHHTSLWIDNGVWAEPVILAVTRILSVYLTVPGPQVTSLSCQWICLMMSVATDVESGKAGAGS